MLTGDPIGAGTIPGTMDRREYVFRALFAANGPLAMSI